LDGTIGFTVKLALTLTPPLEAVSTSGVTVVTVPAVAVKVAVVALCGTVTEPGTDTAAFELESVTVIPPAGAAAEMVTVPWAVCPPRIEAGVMDKVEGTIGLMVRLALRFTPSADPVITTAVAELTIPAVAVNEAVAAPCGTVTDAGRLKVALELESVIIIPPLGAGAEIVTVPDVVWPLRMAAGLTETEVRTIGLMVRLAVVLTPA
jgi:hypothetical protein